MKHAFFRGFYIWKISTSFWGALWNIHKIRSAALIFKFLTQTSVNIRWNKIHIDSFLYIEHEERWSVRNGIYFFKFCTWNFLQFKLPMVHRLSSLINVLISKDLEGFRDESTRSTCINENRKEWKKQKWNFDCNEWRC